MGAGWPGEANSDEGFPLRREQYACVFAQVGRVGNGHPGGILRYLDSHIENCYLCCVIFYCYLEYCLFVF